MASPPRSFDMTVTLDVTATIPRGQTFTIVPVPGGGTRASWTVDDFGVPWPHGPSMCVAGIDGHDPGDEDAP